MKQVLIKKGKAIVEEVPAPSVERGTVLVETAYSCISIGTEMAGVKEGSKSLIQRAIENPEYVATAARMAVEQGIRRTLSIVRGVLESGNPTGYSASGTVIQVGEEITDIQIGEPETEPAEVVFEGFRQLSREFFVAARQVEERVQLAAKKVVNPGYNNLGQALLDLFSPVDPLGPHKGVDQ